MPLAPPYFPVDAPHWMPGPQPTHGKPEGGGTCLELDDERTDYLTAKRVVAEAGASGPFRASGVEDDERRVCEWLPETVQREHPSAAVPHEAPLDQLVLGIEEEAPRARPSDGSRRRRAG